MALSPPFSDDHRADPFGDWPQWRKDLGLGAHRGLDWNGLAKGTPIPASADGVVAWRTDLADPETTELGHRIVVYYPAERVYIGYCHLAANPTLAMGDAVKRGQTVGLLGNSGTATTGAHLHMTASWSNGNPGTVAVIDPANFLTGTTVASIGSSPITNGNHQMSTIIVRSAQNGACYLWNLETGATQHIVDAYRLGLLQKALPTIEYAEENQFAFVRTQYGATLGNKAVGVDTVAIVAAVSAAIAKAGVTVDASAIAAAVDGVLADNFAAIPGAVGGNLAERLKA